MKTTIKIGVITVLAMALFVMAFAAIPMTSAVTAPCAYISGYTCAYTGGSYNWYCYASDALGTCCHDQQWAALNIELWVDGTHIPPTDVQSPWSASFTSTSSSITFHAWATHACAAGCSCGYC